MTEIGRPMFHLVVLVLQQSSAQHIQGGAGRSGTHKTFEYIIIFVTTNPNFTKFSLRVIYGREFNGGLTMMPMMPWHGAPR